MEQQPDERKKSGGRSAAGIVLIVFLAIVFIALLALVLRMSKDDTPAPAPSESSQVYVVPLALRLREEPNTRARIVDTLPRGTELTLLNIDGAWARVRTASGTEAWTDRNALESAVDRERRLSRAADIRHLPPLDGEVVAETQLYAGPGLFYPVIGKLDPGSSVRVFTRDHEFYAVDLGDGIAYAEVQAIDLSDAGGFQFEVAGGEQATVDELGEPVEVEMPEAAPPVAEALPEPEPVPAAEPARPAASARRVYPSVPAGGTAPQLVRRVEPDYPRAARRAGIEGTVILRGIVQRDGGVTDVEVVKDLPLGLGEAARRAVQRWQFRPATLDGTPIATYYTITVNYRLE